MGQVQLLSWQEIALPLVLLKWWRFRGLFLYLWLILAFFFLEVVNNYPQIEKSVPTVAPVPAMHLYWINAGVGLLKYICLNRSDLLSTRHYLLSIQMCSEGNSLLSLLRYLDCSSSHVSLSLSPLSPSLFYSLSPYFFFFFNLVSPSISAICSISGR